MSGNDIQVFLAESRIELRVFQQWVERRWIGTGEAAPELSDADAARALFIRDLTCDFGVNDEGVDLVLHLVDQMHGLRRALDELRRQLRAGGTGAGED